MFKRLFCIALLAVCGLHERDLRAQNSASELFLPHVANGFFGGGVFKTTFILVNVERKAVEVSLALTADDGGALELSLLENGAAAGISSQFRFRIPPGGSRVLHTNGSGPATTGAARIKADGRITASAVFSLVDSQGELLTEAGVGSSPLLSDFRLPVDLTGAFQTGVALFNPAPTNARVTLQLFDQSGASRGQTAVDVAPGGHLARFVNEFFPLAGGIRGSARISSDVALAATVLRQNSSPLAYTTLPVVAGNSVQTEFNLPHIAHGAYPGGSIRTAFLVFGVGAARADLRLELTGDDGAPLEISLGSLGTAAAFDSSIEANGLAVFETSGSALLRSGSARLTSNVPVGVAAIFSIFDAQGAFVTETGVGDSPLQTEATLPVGVNANFDTGLALFNPGSEPVDVSMVLVDPFGRRLSGPQREEVPILTVQLNPGGHLARFATDLFPGLRNFRGTLGLVASDKVVALTLRQNNAPLSYTTLPVAVGARAPVAGEGVLLNEVSYLHAQALPQFVELKVAGGLTRLPRGLQLRTSEGAVFPLPAGWDFARETGLALIVFDGQAGVQGATVHAAPAQFLNTSSGFLQLENRDGFLLDRISWGPEQPDAPRVGRGGVAPDIPPGFSIARLPGSSQALASREWSGFGPEQATPGQPNPLPEVGALMPLSGASAPGPGVTLSWHPVAGMKRYRVQVSADSGFQSTVFDGETEVSLINLTGLQPAEYFWRVQAVTGSGQTALFSPVETFSIEAPLQQAPGTVAADAIEENSIEVPQIAQKKDTFMLLLEADEEFPGGGHRWDEPHAFTNPDDPADYMNCELATTVMVNRYYGGRLSQDRLGYELLKDIGPRGPEWDLNYGGGGFDANIHQSMLNWALRPSTPITTTPLARTPEGLDRFWEDIKASIDAGRPIVIWIGESRAGSSAHAVVIHGYRRIGGIRSVLVRDPWQTTPFVWSGRSLENTAWALGYWVMPPVGQASPRSDEESIAADTDRDGVVDFDEVNRFKTNPNRSDSDGDLINDYVEIRASVFDPEHGYWLKVHPHPDTFLDAQRDAFFLFHDPEIPGSTVRDDVDGDGKHMELDVDSDGGGCTDGFEDFNWNGRQEAQERSNFEGPDDLCHLQGRERRTLVRRITNFRMKEELTEQVDARFCAGPPIKVDGATTSAPNRARIEWSRKVVYSYEPQNFYCAQAFTVTDQWQTTTYVTGVNGGTSPIPSGATLLASPSTRGLEAAATRTAPGACEKFTDEAPKPQKWDAQFGMWFGLGPGSISPWNFAFPIPVTGIERSETLPAGPEDVHTSVLNIWFVDRSEAEAAEPCALEGD
jgi:hypothetical protein